MTNLGQSWLVTISSFGMVFWHVLEFLKIVCIFQATCAARNVQNFGDLMCSSGAWWFSWWCWRRVSLLSSCSMNAYLNMACRDGFPKRSCLKQHCINTGGKSWSIMAGNYLGFLVGFLSCAPHSDSRFQFPFVQYHSFIWGFRFWARELPENSVEKVWATANF